MSSPSPPPPALPAAPPRPVPGLPVLGNALDGFRDPAGLFLRGYREVGPVFAVNYPGRALVMLAGLEANLLLAREGRAFDAAATYALVTRELGTDQIPNAHEGERHRALRRRLAPSLSAQGLEPWTARLHERVRAAAESAPEGGFAALDLLEPLVTDLVTTCTFGRSAPSGLFRDVRRYGTWMGAIGVGRAFPEGLLYTPPLRASRRRLDAFVREALGVRRDPPGEARPPDLVDALRGADADPAALLAQALLPLKNAGIYLARLLSFAWWELLRDPALAERVRAEVDAAWVGGPPDLERLRRCAVLQGLLLEALRLHPMALAIPRVLAAPLSFAGHALAAGELVYFATTVTHHLPELFPDPERFDPDRYRPGRDEHRRPGAWVPFGVGSHSCLARGWSLGLAAIALGGLVRAGVFAAETPGAALSTAALPSPVPEARFRVRRVSLRPPPVPVPGEVAGVAITLDAMSDDARRAVDAGLRAATFPAGAVVFRQGDPSETFHVIREGVAEVLVADPDGTSRLVARLGPGECFGETGLLQHVPRTATVRASAEGALSVTTLDREAFEVLAVDGDLLRSELATMVERRALGRALARALPALDAGGLARVAPRARRITREAGSVVLRRGDAATAFYVLAEGAVEVLAEPAAGPPFVIATLAAVDFFGEIGLLAGRPRTATVRVAADGPATLLELDAEAFAEILGESATSRALAEAAGARLLALFRDGAG